MAFSGSCQSIRLEGDAVLVAECNTVDGSSVEARLDLDGCLGNSDGSFDIGGNEFVDTAKGIRLVGTKLKAKLRDVAGRYQKAMVDLDYFIANVNGQLRHIRPGTGCAVCRDFFQGYEEPVTLTDLRSDERQNGCLRCELLETSIVQYSPKVDEDWEEEEEEDHEAHYEDERCDVEVVEVDHQQQDQRSVSAVGFGSPLMYLTFSNGKLKSKQYQLYSTHDNRSMLFDMIPPASVLSGDARSRSSLTWIAGELSHCKTYHDPCPAPGSVVLPRRVVDVGSERQPPKVYISNGDVGTYACLSHCWGDSNTLKATTESIAGLQEMVPWDELGKTYQDAINYCRELKIRYIWIDSLCILQDSLEDWNIEAPKMASYYGGCYVCLAATASANHTGGCRVRTEDPLTFEGMGFDGKRYNVAIRPEIPALTDPGRFPHQQYFPLLTRGWVFQERRLAPRVLHFGPAELVLECNTTQSCECGCAREAVSEPTTKAAMHQPITAYTMQEFHVKLEQEWHRMVETYSGLKLTFPTDRLPALAGAATETRERREENGVAPGLYLDGLWEKTFANDLLWSIARAYGEPARPRALTGAPSWSWASVVEAVKFSALHYDECFCAFERVHAAAPAVEMDVQSPSVISSVASVLIRAQHGLRRAETGCLECSDGVERFWWHADEDRNLHYFVPASSDAFEARSIATVYLLPVARHSKSDKIAWVVLRQGERYHDSDDDAPLFYRVGRLDDTDGLAILGTQPSGIHEFCLA